MPPPVVPDAHNSKCPGYRKHRPGVTHTQPRKVSRPLGQVAALVEVGLYARLTVKNHFLAAGVGAQRLIGQHVVAPGPAHAGHVAHQL